MNEVENDFNETAKKNSILMSLPIILIIGFFTCGIGTIILTIIRIRKSEIKWSISNIVLMICCAFIIIFYINIPYYESQDRRAKEKLANKNSIENGELREQEENISENGQFGCPDEENWLKEYGFDVTCLPNKDALMYAYYGAKVARIQTHINSMEEMYEYNKENLYLSTYEETYQGVPSINILDTFIWGYRGDDLATKVLSKLGNGDADKGYAIYESVATAIWGEGDPGDTVDPVEVDYVYSMEAYAHDYGSYTKEEVYQMISDSYVSSNEYIDITRYSEQDINNMMRNNQFNIGQKIVMTGQVLGVYDSGHAIYFKLNGNEILPEYTYLYTVSVGLN